MINGERDVAFDVEDIFAQAHIVRRGLSQVKPGLETEETRLSSSGFMESVAKIKIDGPLLTKEELDAIVEKMRAQDVARKQG